MEKISPFVSPRWQCRLATTRDRITELWQSSYLSDLTITFPGYKKVLKAHRLVLAMSSPVFEAMLYGSLAEDFLTLHGYPPDAIEWLLKYIYCDETTFPGIDMAIQVYRLSHQYQLDTLFQVCSQYLEDNVDGENFLRIYEPALLMDDQQMLHRCGEVLAASSEDVLRSREMPLLQRPTLHQLLSHPKLCVSSEVSIFLALKEWGLMQLKLSSKEAFAMTDNSRVKKSTAKEFKCPEYEKAQPSSICEKTLSPQLEPDEEKEETLVENPQEEGLQLSELRKEVEEFLPLVRFLTMTTDEMVQHVLPSGVFTDNEGIAILKTMKGIVGARIPQFVLFQATMKRDPLVKSVTLYPPITCLSNDIKKNFTFNGELHFDLLEDFQASKAICIVTIMSACITSLNKGIVQVKDVDENLVGRGVWQGTHGTFKQPVKLVPSKTYSAKLIIDNAWYSSKKSNFSTTHEAIDFYGYTSCNGTLIMKYFLADVK